MITRYSSHFFVVGENLPKNWATLNVSKTIGLRGSYPRFFLKAFRKYDLNHSLIFS